MRSSRGLRRAGLVLAAVGLLGCDQGSPTAPVTLPALMSQTVRGVTIEILSADPPSEGTIVLADCTPVCGSLTLRYTSDRTETIGTGVALITASGDECGYGHGGEVALEPGRPVVVSMALYADFGLDSDCVLPRVAAPGQRPTTRTSMLSVRLREVQAGVRAPVVEARFAWPYGWAGALLPAVSGPLTITKLDWEWSGAGRDYLYIRCLVHDETGDALDVGMGIETESCLVRDVCWRQAAPLPAGAPVRDMLVRQGYGYIDAGRHIQGQLTCAASDSHGNRATRSVPICIDGPEGHPCPPA